MSNGLPPSQPLNAENLAQFGSMMPPPNRTGSPLSHAHSLPNFNFENWDLASSETLSSFAPSQHAFTSFGGPTGLGNLGSFSNDLFEPFFRDIFGLSSIQETAQDTYNTNGDNSDLNMEEILSRDPQRHPVVDNFIFAPDANTQPLDDQLMHDMMVNTYPTPPEAEALDTILPPAPGAPLFQQQLAPQPAPVSTENSQSQPEPAKSVSTASYPSPPNSLPTPPSSVPEEPAEPTTEELQHYCTHSIPSALR